MGLAALALILFPAAIARLFTPDPAVVSMSAHLLVIAAFFQLFDGMQTVATGALRGAGDTRTPMLTHLVCYWVFGLPVGAWLCFRGGMGAPGLWIGFTLALILIGLVLLFAWQRRTMRFVEFVRNRRPAFRSDRDDVAVPETMARGGLEQS